MAEDGAGSAGVPPLPDRLPVGAAEGKPIDLDPATFRPTPAGVQRKP